MRQKVKSILMKEKNRMSLIVLYFEREGTKKEEEYVKCRRQKVKSERHPKPRELGYTKMEERNVKLHNEKSRAHPIVPSNLPLFCQKVYVRKFKQLHEWFNQDQRSPWENKALKQ